MFYWTVTHLLIVIWDNFHEKIKITDLKSVTGQQCRYALLGWGVVHLYKCNANHINSAWPNFYQWPWPPTLKKSIRFISSPWSTPLPSLIKIHSIVCYHHDHVYKIISILSITTLTIEFWLALNRIYPNVLVSMSTKSYEYAHNDSFSMSQIQILSKSTKLWRLKVHLRYLRVNWIIKVTNLQFRQESRHLSSLPSPQSSLCKYNVTEVIRQKTNSN